MPELPKESSRELRNKNLQSAGEQKPTPKNPRSSEREFDQARKQRAASGTLLQAKGGSTLLERHKRRSSIVPDGKSGVASPRPDGLAAMPLQTKRPVTSRQRTLKAAAEAAHLQRAFNSSPQLLSNITSGISKTGFPLMRRSGEHSQDMQPPTYPAESASDSKDGKTLHGSLLVPLVHGEEGWTIDWDALRFAANPPQLTPDLPLENLQVCIVVTPDLLTQ